MSVFRRLVLTAAVLVALPGSALCIPIPSTDFSTAAAGDKITNLGGSAVFGTGGGAVEASAFYYNPDTKTWLESILIARDENNDHGLGVCSEDLEDCDIGGTGNGDWNELSQLYGYTEAIMLEKLDPGAQWNSLWVSSLDGNTGEGDNENGTLYWGNVGDPAGLIASGNSFNFTFPHFAPGVVEGPLTLPGTFIQASQYLLFVPGNGLVDDGDDNDYLVWGATLAGGFEGDDPVPEPASLVLLGSGLVGLVARARRSRR